MPSLLDQLLSGSITQPVASSDDARSLLGALGQFFAKQPTDGARSSTALRDPAQEAAANQSMIDAMQHPQMGSVPGGLPYTASQAWPSVGGPMGFGGGGALQTGSQPSPASATGYGPAPASASQSGAPANPPPISISPATGKPDVTVDDQGNASDAQPNSSDLFTSLAPAAADAATSPAKSKTLLESLGSTVSGIGDKLTNLSPNASQALLASGLTILAGNDGTRNLGQLVGIGGIAGLNSYNANREQQAANALAQQKTNQEQQHWQTETGLKAQQQAWEQRKPVAVGQDQSLYAPQSDGTFRPVVQAQPGVARTLDMQGNDGNTYTVQLDRNGNQVGQPILKTNPNVGPLNGEQQTAVNAAQTAAQTARQTYQNTAYLANQVANAPDWGKVGQSFNDFLTGVTGNKDSTQQLRGQLAQFANSSILSELPPGSASDKDIQLVRNGVPADTASKETWQAYLSAVGRVQQIAALTASAKADFLTANRANLGPLQHDATINGVQYGAGTQFSQVLSGSPPQQQSRGSAGAVPYSTLAAAAARRGWK